MGWATGSEGFFPIMPAILAMEMAFVHSNGSSIDDNGLVVHQCVCDFAMGIFQDAPEGRAGNAKVFGAFFLGFAVQVCLT